MQKRKKLPYPTWQIDNALAKVRELRALYQRALDNPDNKANEDKNILAIRLLDHMELVIKGINEIEGPQPPTFGFTMQKVLGKFIKGIAETMESMASALHSFNKWDFRNHD